MKNNVHTVVVSQDKSFAYVANINSGLLCKINLEKIATSKDALTELKLGFPIAEITLTQNDKILIASDMMDNVLAIIDTKNWTAEIKHPFSARLFARVPKSEETASITMGYQKS